MDWNIVTSAFAALFLLHHGFEFALDALQNSYLKKRADRVPKHLEGKVEIETVRKAVAYNRDKLRLAMVARIHGAVAVWVMILVGFSAVDGFAASLELGPLAEGLIYLAVLGLAGTLWDLPLELISTFGVEQRHGFNRQTYSSFTIDKLKEIMLSVILGAVLVSLVLTLMQKGGSLWWVFAFAGVTLLQLLMVWIYPLVIMPMFNRFAPVARDLSDDVAGLARKVGFPLKGVVSMDGSRRSAHSNAFIVGLKGARRIVLYDTLLERIGRSELLAVLGHELGHFRLWHLRRRMVLMVSALFFLFLGLAWLRDLPIAYTGLGFERVTDHAALVVFGLLISELLAPAGWLFRILSRRDEHAADRFSVEAVGNGRDLAEALIALSEQNLSSPGSHRLYRSYHNSHPALRDRLKAISEHAERLGLPNK